MHERRPARPRPRPRGGADPGRPGARALAVGAIGAAKDTSGGPLVNRRARAGLTTRKPRGNDGRSGRPRGSPRGRVPPRDPARAGSGTRAPAPGSRPRCAARSARWATRRSRRPRSCPAPGMEPHIQRFEARVRAGGGRRPRAALAPHEPRVRDEAAPRGRAASGSSSSSRVFRNGEVSAHPQPRVHDARALPGGHRLPRDHGGPRAARGGVRARARAGGGAARGAGRRRARPRRAVRAAHRRGGVRAPRRRGPRRLRRATRRGSRRRRAPRGTTPGPPGEPFDDVFFRVMLDAVEPRLGAGAPDASSSTGRPRWRRSRG